MNGIAFQVQGYPPAKSDGQFMLDANHPHTLRVHLLLEAARKAQVEQGFKPIEEAWVKLDVLFFDSIGDDPYDATSYLSGIVEVLEERSLPGSMTHLGELGAVWLYRNRLQVKEITYRLAEGSKALYAITIESRLARQAHGSCQASNEPTQVRNASGRVGAPCSVGKGLPFIYIRSLARQTRQRRLRLRYKRND